MKFILKVLELLVVCGTCMCNWMSGGICDLCLNQPFVVLNDKRVTEGVLWTVQGMNSRAECSSRCHLFDRIKSYGYHTTTGECVAYTVPLQTPTSVTYATETGFNMYSTCAPVDGGISAWTSWGGAFCSVTCGPSASVLMTRSRTCTNPTPANGGADCTEHLTETGDINCELPNCPIDGGVSAWASWVGTCTATCGTAVSISRTRYRTCTNPQPAYDGADCSESLTNTATYDCGLPPCPIDGDFSAWGSWTGSCGNTCGSGVSVTQQRSRSCNNPYPAYGGADCSGSTTETNTLTCNLAACPMSMPNFGSCTSNSQCTSPANTVCEQGLCVCGIMYQYKSGSCVQGCSTYSSEFTSFTNKVLNGYNDRIINSIATIEACVSLCLNEAGFQCVTADYEFNSDTCYLSKTTWFGAPGGRADSSAYHQLIRNCA